MLLIKKLTVLDNSLPDSIILRHSGIISVANKKFMTCCSSVYNKSTYTFINRPIYKYDKNVEVRDQNNAREENE